MENSVEAVRQLVAPRHFVRNASIANLCFSTHDALGNGGRGGEESARNLLGCQAAHLAQRQCYLRLRRQGRMTTGENQAQPVVFDILLFICRLDAGSRSVELLGKFHKRRIETSAFSK